MIFARLFVVWFWSGLALSAYLFGGLALSVRYLFDRKQRALRVHKFAGRLLAWLAGRLGATFIKLGQIISARPDLLPPLIIAELRTLQDHAPAFPTARARQMLSELGANAQQLLDTLSPLPIAAASIAQVYEARLADGTRVAVKIRRPGVEQLVRLDLAIMVFAARILNWIPWLRPIHLDALSRQFARAVGAQVDFPLEVRNNLRFAKNFADLPHVSVARVHPDLCTRQVIVMDFVTGRKIYDVVTDPHSDRATLGRRFLDLYYHMAFGDMFLHADLHPGNILIDDAGNITLLDTGLVYEIPVHYAKKFLRVAIALTTRDGRVIGQAYLEGIEMSDAARKRALDDLDALAKRHLVLHFSDIEIGVLIVDIMRTLRKNGIVLEAEWAGLMLSDITFEGLAKMMDSEIDILAIAAPFVLKHALKHNLLDMTDPIVIEATRVASRVKRESLGAEL